jgi:uncharacterized protein (TIGR00369 family)
VSKMSTEEIQRFLKREFPHRPITVESVGRGRARLHYEVTAADLRPGRTISGPTMMALADAATYVAILGEKGLVAGAVTSSLNIHFLRKPVPHRPLRAEATLLKLGTRLAVAEVRITAEGSEELLAQASVTYALPAGEG